MELTHPGQQLILYLDVFVEFVLCLFYGVFHTSEVILFHNFICFVCLYLVCILYGNLQLTSATSTSTPPDVVHRRE